MGHLGSDAIQVILRYLREVPRQVYADAGDFERFCVDDITLDK